MSDLESVWEFREEELYPRLFGKMTRGIFVLDFETFSGLSSGPVDPRWLHLGVFEFQPTPARSSWLYVTSGGSTPWETEAKNYNEAEYSWLGVEFVLETPHQADWPINVLRRLLAYHVLACHGRFGEAPIPDYGHRIPTGGPIDGKQSVLRFVAICKPTHYQSTAQLASGKFDFLHVVGISETERDFAKASSTESLITLLEANGAAPVTNPLRQPIACGA